MNSEVLITHKERPPEEKVLIAAVCPPSGRPFTLQLCDFYTLLVRELSETNLLSLRPLQNAEAFDEFKVLRDLKYVVILCRANVKLVDKVARILSFTLRTQHTPR